MVDIRNYPKVIDAINAVINSRGLAEVKIEPKGIAVVEQKRYVMITEPTTNVRKETGK